MIIDSRITKEWINMAILHSFVLVALVMQGSYGQVNVNFTNFIGGPDTETIDALSFLAGGLGSGSGDPSPTGSNQFGGNPSIPGNLNTAQLFALLNGGNFAQPPRTLPSNFAAQPLISDPNSDAVDVFSFLGGGLGSGNGGSIPTDSNELGGNPPIPDDLTTAQLFELLNGANLSPPRPPPIEGTETPFDPPAETEAPETPIDPPAETEATETPMDPAAETPMDPAAETPMDPAVETPMDPPAETQAPETPMDPAAETEAPETPMEPELPVETNPDVAVQAAPVETRTGREKCPGPMPTDETKPSCTWNEQKGFQLKFWPSLIPLASICEILAPSKETCQVLCEVNSECQAVHFCAQCSDHNCRLLAEKEGGPRGLSLTKQFSFVDFMEKIC